jgi:hypothetical protein
MASSISCGLYESRITVPQWLSFVPGAGYRWNPAAANEANVGLRWWLISVGAALVDRVLTFGYFIPTMIRLTRGDFRPESVAVTKARQWVRLGYLRHAATLFAWLAALQAIALIHGSGN